MPGPAIAASLRWAGLASVLFMQAGCATIVRGRHETFRVVSMPSGAVVQLSSGETCVTPCAVELQRADPIQVRIAKPGYVTQIVAVRSVGTGSGGIGLLSNAVVGGLIGASVDLSSGAMRSLTPNPVKVQLVENPAIAPAPPPTAPSDIPAQAPVSPPPAAATR